MSSAFTSDCFWKASIGSLTRLNPGFFKALSHPQIEWKKVRGAGLSRKEAFSKCEGEVSFNASCNFW